MVSQSADLSIFLFLTFVYFHNILTIVIRVLPKVVAFEWDKGNIDKNLKKHNVSHQEAEEIFFDRYIKIFENIKHSQKEKRFTALGANDRNRKLYLSFTIRNQKIRIISARDQSKKERRLYEKK